MSKRVKIKDEAQEKHNDLLAAQKNHAEFLKK